MGFHSPFHAFLGTENSPAIAQPRHWVSASPMLSPADWHLSAIIHGSEANSDFTLFPSVPLA